MRNRFVGNNFYCHCLSPKAFKLLETQNDPYWLMKKSGNVSKCRGCQEKPGEIILGGLELDFLLKVDHVKEAKH